MSKSKEDFVTVTSGMSGYFAIHMTYNLHCGGFWEPQETGFGRYATTEGAEDEARDWAKDMEVECRV